MVTQCNNCFESCHDGCRVEDKFYCIVMENDHCTICKGKCPYQAHVNSTQVITMVDKTVTVDDQEMKQRYCQAESDKSAYEQIKDGLENEIRTTQMLSLQIHLEIQECFMELDKIAAVPNVYDTAKYFDLLIKAEENKDQTPETLANLKELRYMREKERELAELYQSGMDRRQIIENMEIFVHDKENAGGNG